MSPIIIKRKELPDYLHCDIRMAMRICKDAGAVVKYGKYYFVNLSRLTAYIDSISGSDSQPEEDSNSQDSEDDLDVAAEEESSDDEGDPDNEGN